MMAIFALSITTNALLGSGILLTFFLKTFFIFKCMYVYVSFMSW